MPTAEEVYAAARTLPPPERLRLVALILDELAQTLPPTPDLQDIPTDGDGWTDKDSLEFAAHRAPPKR